MLQGECNRLPGFCVGDNPRTRLDMDLPHSTKTPLLPMTTGVHSHIMKTGTLNGKHEYTKLIKTCPGDGYRAIKLIIMRSYPNFIEEPAQYLTGYSKQKKDGSVFNFTQVLWGLSAISISLL